MNDLLLKGGLVVDPANGVHGQCDITVTRGQVTAVEPDLPAKEARRVLDVSGHWVFPGLVDTHVHLCQPFGGPQGHRMLAKAGVTCAIDMAGKAELLIDGLRQAGAGLSVGFVYPLVPSETVNDINPGRSEIIRARDAALQSGALGLKVLGGHYPLSPDSTSLVVRTAHEASCWCAVHAGTTTAGSDIEGLEQLIHLADGLPLHVAHINSYCRGQKTGDPLTEASRAIRALVKNPRARSESYMAAINGAVATVETGVPKSNVVKTCLTIGGFEPTATGMEQAIESGWAVIQDLRDGETILLSPQDGIAHYRACGSRVGVSFPVNPPESAIALAIAKRNGDFVITAFATDGGAIPRNTTLLQGLALVRFGALTVDDFVIKACLNPAQMVGIPTKGHLGPGADADITVVDPVSAHAQWVVAHGEIIVQEGSSIGKGGRLVSTDAGKAFVAAQGVENQIVSPDWLQVPTS